MEGTEELEVPRGPKFGIPQREQQLGVPQKAPKRGLTEGTEELEVSRRPKLGVLQMEPHRGV